MRFLNVLMALLMMTSGMAAMSAAAPGDATIGVVDATAEEAGCVADDVTNADCEGVGSPGDTLSEDEGQFLADEAALLMESLPSECNPEAGGDPTSPACHDAMDTLCQQDPGDPGCTEVLPIQVEDENGVQVITLNASATVIVIRADPGARTIAIEQDGQTVFDSSQSPIDAGGETHVANFEYTMTPCDDSDDDHALDPFCYERLSSGIYVDIDSAHDPIGGADDTVEEDGALQSWARIRFDDDAHGREDYTFDGDMLVNQPVADANENPHERASGAFHIGPEICTYTTADTTGNSGDSDTLPNPRCSSTNLYNDILQNDGRDWDTISELHIKVPPNNDYARYFLHSDLDDDGQSDFAEINCGSHPLHQESTCDDFDGDGLSNAAELIWAGGNPFLDSDGDGIDNLYDRDSDNDGLIDGLEDPNGNGMVDAPDPLFLDPVNGTSWYPAEGQEPNENVVDELYSQLWKQVNIGDALLEGDTATLNRDALLGPGDEAHDDDEVEVFPGFWNPYPAHPAERDRHLAMGLETSPISSDSDGDDHDGDGSTRGRFDEVGRNFDWHRDPFHRDPHPQDALIDNQDTDGDELFDSCELETYLEDGEGRLAPSATLATLGSYATQDDHTGDEDNDGVLNKKDCDLTDHIYDVDADHDGLDDKEETDGLLKTDWGTLPFDAAFPSGPTDPAHPDTDRDGVHDGVELFADWDGNTVELRWNSTTRMTQGISNAEAIKPLYADIDPLMTPDVRIQMCASPLAADLIGCSDVDTDDVPDGPLVVQLESAYADRTDPAKVDTDDDGLADSDELEGAARFELGHRGWAKRSAHNFFLTSDPTNPDTDDDGYTDGQDVKDSVAAEARSCHRDGHGNSGAIDACDAGFDAEPWLPDTDGDGLTDWEEDQGPFLNEVTVDALGIPAATSAGVEGGDFDEAAEGADVSGGEDGVFVGDEHVDTPLNHCDAYLYGAVTDLPRTSCTYEYRGDRRVVDTDGDGLSDARELKDESDPHNCGSDCDGGYGTFVAFDHNFVHELGYNSTDSDNDGRLDGHEADGQSVIHPEHGNYTLGPSDPLNPDTDGDGISDGDEVAGPFFADPNMLDSDGDGLSDRREQYHTSEDACEPPILVEDAVDDEVEAETDMRPLNTCDGGYGTDPLVDDTDGDTFPDLEEVTTGTDPLDPNSWPNGDIDGDGLLDLWETHYFGNLDEDEEGDPDGDDFTNADEFATFDGVLDNKTIGPNNAPDSDPTDPDSTPDDRDADGMGFAWEVEHFGSEWAEKPAGDHDSDNLTNGFEHDEEYFVQPPAERDPVFPEQGGTDPTSKDTDGDGLEDGQEVDQHGTNPLLKDSDGDGLDDPVELDGSANTVWGNESTNPTAADTDLDGLTDGEEILNGGPDYDGDGTADNETDPNRVDTDGDNYNDGLEVQRGTNPRDSADNPGAQLAAAGIPNPLTVLTDSECDFTTPSTWTEQGDPPVPHWDGTACDDTSVPDLAAPVLSDLLTELARIQDGLDDIEPGDPVHEGLEFSDTIVDFGGRSASGVIAQAQFVDQADPRDVDGDGDFQEPNGQIDVLERSLLYYDRDEDNAGSVDEFSGEDGYTVTVMHATSPFAPMASDKALVIRVGDVNGTEEEESLIIETGTGNTRAVYCLTKDDKQYVTLGWFRDNGCGRYQTEGGTGFDISDRDRDGLPHDFDNCPEASNPDQEDLDEDGVGDGCDGDRDGDGTADGDDAFPDDSEESEDADGDGVGDNSDPWPRDSERSADTDGDGVADDGPEPDNCSEVSNAGQEDLDGDGTGDACDDDIDGDMFPNDVEANATSDPADEESTPVTVVTSQVPSQEEVQEALDGLCAGAELEGSFPECVGEVVPTPEEIQEVLDGACAAAELEGTFPDCFTEQLPTPEEVQGLANETVCTVVEGEAESAEQCLQEAVPTPDEVQELADAVVCGVLESDGEGGVACAMETADSNGNGMPDALEPHFGETCTDYGGQPVYLCHHGEGVDRDYYVIVFGVDAQVDI